MRGKKKWKWKSLSRVWLWNPMNCIVHGIFQARILEWLAFPFSRGSSQPRDQTQVTCIAGGLFYHLSHKGSPRILAWVAYPFSRGSSWPKNWTKVSCIADGVFATWAIRDDQQSRGSIPTLLNTQHDVISSLFIWRLLASIFLELFPLPQLCYLPMLLTNLLWLFLLSKEKYWKTSGLAKSELNISWLHQLQDSIKWQSLQTQTWTKRTRKQTTLIYHLKIFFQLNILIMIWWVQIIVVCHMLPSWTI